MFVKGNRMFRNFLIDIRYGGFLGFNLKPTDIFLSQQEKAARTVETPYWRSNWIACMNNSDSETLEYVFQDRIKATDVLVDVGCGRGRVINWWLYKGYRNRMVGLEMDVTTAENARKRLRRCKNVTVVTGNAVENLPPEGTIFYLFNPFDAPVVAAFKERIKQVVPDPKQITILYSNCRHVDVFQDDPDWNVELIIDQRPIAAPMQDLAVITFR
jgi:SAM-dependent methyltransferase